MGNPKKANMELHTRQKVAIYDAYLKRYLRIVSLGYSRVNLYDPCSGKGKYGDCDGSAVVACNNFRQLAEYEPVEGYHLYLNEPDTVNRRELEQVCCHPFVECIDGQDAELFVTQRCCQDVSGHKLWFIDPYGYTQVGKTAINMIMRQRSSEVLLFIPLTFLYRFLNGDLDNDPSLRSVVSFLDSYSISQNEARCCSSAHDFANLISKKMQNEYGYCWHATMKEGPLYYSLFFISGHYYGLEKFLEARDKILSGNGDEQLSLIPMGEERELLSLLSQHRSIDNCGLYKLGLLNGYTPSGMRKGLESLEKRNLICVKVYSGIRRRSGSFFIGNKYFKDNDIKLTVEVIQEQATLF